jgi:hypothetical protein
MSETEKLKQERRAQRINDPHEWAYEIEKRADERSLYGALAFLLSVFLAVNVWLLWKERDRLIERLEAVEHQAEEPTINELLDKYAPQN